MKEACKKQSFFFEFLHVFERVIAHAPIQVNHIQTIFVEINTAEKISQDEKKLDIEHQKKKGD